MVAIFCAKCRCIWWGPGCLRLQRVLLVWWRRLVLSCRRLVWRLSRVTSAALIGSGDANAQPEQLCKQQCCSLFHLSALPLFGLIGRV